MGALSITVQTVSLFAVKRGLLMNASPSTLSIIARVEGVEDGDEVAIGLPGPGRAQEAMLYGVKPRSRIEVRIVKSVPNRNEVVGVASCVLSLARLVRGQLRNRMQALISIGPDGNPAVVGYIHIGLQSTDLGATLLSDTTDVESATTTTLTEQQQQGNDELVRQYLHEEASESVLYPRLLQLLLAKDLHLLHLADVILSEGPEFNKDDVDEDDEGEQGRHISDKATDANSALLVGDVDRSPRAYFYQTQLAYNALDMSFQCVGVAVKWVMLLPAHKHKQSQQLLQPLDSSQYFVSLTSPHEEFATRCATVEGAAESGLTLSFQDEQVMGLIEGAHPKLTVLLSTRKDDDDVGAVIGTAVIGLDSVSCRRPCLREFPLVDPLSGQHVANVRLEFYTEDFGDEDVSDATELALVDFYARVASIFKKYDAKRLMSLDEVVTQNRHRQQQFLLECEERYGFEPNTVLLSVGVRCVENLKRSSAPGDFIKNVEGSGAVVCIARLPHAVARTAPCRYADHCAFFHHNASPQVLEAVHHADVLEISVVSADSVSQVFGKAYIPCQHIQRGVAKTRRYPLFINAGTSKAFVSGTVAVTLSSEHRGQDTPVDAVYEAIYGSQVRQLLLSNEPDRAHMADVIVSETPDVETYLMQAERRFRVVGSRTPPRLTVRVKQGQGLPSGQHLRITTVLGAQSYESAGSKIENPVFNKATPLRFAPEDPRDAMLLVYLENKDTGAELGRVVIAVNQLERNALVEKWFTFHHRSRSCGEVLLSLKTENCGVEPLPPTPITPPVKKTKAPKVPPTTVVEEVVAVAPKVVMEETTKAADVNVIANDTWVKGDAGRDTISALATVVEEEPPVPLYDSFAVTIDSVTSLSRNGRIENPVKCFVKLVLRNKAHRTSIVEGSGLNLQFGSRFSFELKDPSKNDVLYAYVYGSDSDGDSHLFGVTEINVTRLYKGRTREADLPIVVSAKMEGAEMCGLLSIRLHCKTYGKPVPKSGPVTLTSEEYMRLRNFYVKYMPGELHRFDFHVDPALGFDFIMGSNIRKYGPEPDTCLLQLTVASCSDLDAPHLLAVSAGYAVTLHVGKRTLETKTVSSSHPEFHESFDFPVDLAEDEIITVVVNYNGSEYGRCLLSLKNIPNRSSKTRTAHLVAQPGTRNAFIRGTVTLGCFTNDFGCKSIPSDEMEKEYRARICSILQRFAPEELHRIEVMLGDNVGTESDLLTSLISKYGCVPGDARLAVTIKEVRGLQKGGKTVVRGDPYVKVKTSMEKSRTKTVRYYKHAYFDENITFDLAHPEKDVLVLTVYNDDVGVNYKYGEVMISLSRLQRGVSRQINALIVHNAGTKQACPGGYVTVVLRSDDFGRKKAILSDRETLWHNRLKYFFLRYSPEKLHMLDVICSTTMTDPEKHMAKLVQSHGPEPPAHAMSVTIDRCTCLSQLKEDVSVMLSCGVDSFVTRAVQPDERTLYLSETFTVNVGDPLTDELTFAVDSRSDKVEYSRAIIPLNNLERDKETALEAFLVENAGTKDARVAGTLLVKLRPLTFGVSPEVAATFSKDAYYVARERLERVLTQNAPTELHRMECMLGAFAGKESKLIPSLKTRYPVETKYAPTTVRMCRLQTSTKGTYSIRCTINDRTLIKSKNVKVELDNDSAFITDGSVVTDIPAAKHSQLCFTLTSHSTFSTVDVAQCFMDLAYCTLGVFNERRLGFFGKSTGEEIAALYVDVRSLEVGIRGDPSALSKTQEKWKGVERDVISVLQAYNPKELAKLDSIVRSASDVEELHGTLLHKYNPKALVTVFLERVVVNVPAPVFKELRKHSDVMFVASIGGISVSNPLIRCQAVMSDASGGDHSATLLEHRAHLEVSLRTTSFSRHLSSALASPVSAASYSVAARVLRLDLAASQLDTPNLNVRIEAGGRVWGHFNISLLALFLSFVDVYTTYEFPLIGTTPRQAAGGGRASVSRMSMSQLDTSSAVGAGLTSAASTPSKRASKFGDSIGLAGPQGVVGTVSLSFSYPYLQAVPRSLIRRRSSVQPPSAASTPRTPSAVDSKKIEQSRAQAQRNHRYVNYFYQRTLDYLLENDPASAASLHVEYFDMIAMGQWDAGCEHILDAHKRRLGVPEGPVAMEPPEIE